MQSLSDLEKLNVSEDLPEMERAEQLLKTGLDKQKISVLSSLPTILASNNSKSNLVLILECIKVRSSRSFALGSLLRGAEEADGGCLSFQVAWHKCEADMNNSAAVVLEIFRGISSLACATVDGKVLDTPSVSFHEEYQEQLEASRQERKDAVFLLSDEQVTKLLVPLVLDIVAEIQSKDYSEAASLAVIASLSRMGGTLKKTQVRARSGSHEFCQWYALTRWWTSHGHRSRALNVPDPSDRD